MIEWNQRIPLHHYELPEWCSYWHLWPRCSQSAPLFAQLQHRCPYSFDRSSMVLVVAHLFQVDPCPNTASNGWMPVSHTDLSAGRFEHMAKYIRLQWKLRTKIIDFVIQTIDNFEEEKRIFGQKSEKKTIQQIEHNSLRISQKQNFWYIYRSNAFPLINIICWTRVRK